MTPVPVAKLLLTGPAPAEPTTAVEDPGRPLVAGPGPPATHSPRCMLLKIWFCRWGEKIEGGTLARLVPLDPEYPTPLSRDMEAVWKDLESARKLLGNCLVADWILLMLRRRLGAVLRLLKDGIKGAFGVL